MHPVISSQHIRALADRFDQATLAEVVRLDPTEEELSEALGWLDGNDGDEPASHPSQARTMASVNIGSIRRRFCWILTPQRCSFLPI